MFPVWVDRLREGRSPSTKRNGGESTSNQAGKVVLVTVRKKPKKKKFRTPVGTMDIKKEAQNTPDLSIGTSIAEGGFKEKQGGKDLVGKAKKRIAEGGGGKGRNRSLENSRIPW